MKLYGRKKPVPNQKRQNAGPNLEEIFHIQIKAVRLPAAQREYRFHPKRQWKFDFAWPHAMVAVEIEGGTYMRGRHVRPEGYRNDAIKYSEAAILGWKVLRGDSQMVKTGALLALAERALTTTERK